ncbi:MAG: porin family protein [Pseudomonadota bacterium]
MIKRTHWLIGVAVAAAFAAQPAYAQVGRAAQADGWGTFLGASIGDSDYDTGFKLFAGQQFHRNFAWEVQYTNFGDRTERRFGTFVDAEAWALGGSLVGLLPVSPDFSLFGKLGAHYTKVRYSAPGISSSDSNVDLGIGAGLSYRLTSQLTLRAEIEDIGDPGEMVSVGLQFRF